MMGLDIFLTISRVDAFSLLIGSSFSDSFRIATFLLLLTLIRVVLTLRTFSRLTVLCCYFTLRFFA